MAFKSGSQRKFMFAMDMDKQKGINPSSAYQQKSPMLSGNPAPSNMKNPGLSSLQQNITSPLNTLPQTINKLKMPKLPAQRFLKLKTSIKK